ncbi:MAG: hypothetical protein ACR2OH_08125 [Microthrixaceae bacterium]
MHPIERLRFVARAQGVPGDVLATEATAALMTFADDPPALVAGCRRVLSRQAGCGPLWWACARLLTADDVRSVARDSIAQLEGDTTAAALSIALFDHSEVDESEVDEQLVRAHAIGDGGAVVDATDLRHFDSEADERWLVAGVGVHLSTPMWGSLVEHWSTTSSDSEDLVPLDQFTHFVGPDGPLPLVALGEPDCPVAPELFRLAG